MTKQRFIFGYIDGVKILMDYGKFVPDNIALELLNELAEENEQLKSDNNRLVNETAKIIGEHQRKVFDLIDKKIADYNMYYETQIEDQSYNEANAMKECVIALENLKKELQE